MDRKLQNEALQEIMNTLEVIIKSDSKGVTDKTSKALVNKLNRMGVKKEEMEILLEWARQRLVDNLTDDDDTQNNL